MRKEECEVFEQIQRVQRSQGLLLEKPKTAQQELLHICAQRLLVSKQMLHKHIDEVLRYLPGTFAHLALNMLYLSVCIEMRVEINTEEYPLLKKLLEWTQTYPDLRDQKISKITAAVLPKNELTAFREYEEYIAYINFIGGDLLKLMKKQRKQKQQSASQNEDPNLFLPIDPDDLLAFLLNSLPKVLYNIILPAEVLPNNFKSQFKAMEVLYRVSSQEYFMKAKSTYAALVKILVNLLLKMELKPAQQKLMMEVVFRYFFVYHTDKAFKATDVFIEAYNTLSETTRFAMADEFVLFFKIISKVGKGKFVDFLVQKSPWLKETVAKVSDKNMVGYAKQNFSPYPNLRISETISIANKKSEVRTFQIIEDYSLLYFSVEVQSHDINLKLYYLGEITDKRAGKTLLMSQEKLCGPFRTNLMATKRGIYQFEFDNTYSWINYKTVKFEKVLLSPLELQSPDHSKWAPAFYDHLVLNSIADRSKVYLIQNAQPQPQKEEDYEGVANITKSGKFLNMKITKINSVYEFQTTNEDKLVKRFNELIDKERKIKWMVSGQPLQQPGNLQKSIARNIDTAATKLLEVATETELKPERERELKPEGERELKPESEKEVKSKRQREAQAQKKEKIESKYQEGRELPKPKAAVSQKQELQQSKQNLIEGKQEIKQEQ